MVATNGGLVTKAVFSPDLGSEAVLLTFASPDPWAEASIGRRGMADPLQLPHPGTCLCTPELP
jgi:hypothetical protein